jgi:ABC-type Na+ efflux pump permease subunit
MDLRRVRILMLKEIRVVFGVKHNARFLFGVCIAVCVVVVASAIAYNFGWHPGQWTSLQDQIQLLDFAFRNLFFLFPTGLAANNTADAFAGEKERKTVETLLTLPCTNAELIAGKVFATLIPALLLSGLLFLTLGLTFDACLIGTGVSVVFNEMEWIVVAGLFTPLLMLDVTLLGVVASALFNSIKKASNVTAVPVLLLMFVAVYLIINRIDVGVLPLLDLSGIFGIIAIGLYGMAKRSLNREKFLLQTD